MSKNTIDKAPASKKNRRVDEISYQEEGVEGKEEVAVQGLAFPGSPVRFVKALRAPKGAVEQRAPVLFADTAGIFGAAGVSMACRGQSVWWKVPGERT